MIRYVAIFLFLCASLKAEDFAFFESKIRPALIEHCYECHSVESGNSKGDLLVDSRDAIRKGGSSGPAVVPGNPAESLLFTAIRHDDPDLEMPPRKAKLPDSLIADFKKWIESGAPDPREVKEGDQLTYAPTSIEEGRKFRFFQKPGKPEIPSVSDTAWPESDLDHFLLAELEKNDLSPSPDAPAHVLLRRLHFDITGLPPSPDDLSLFRKDIENHDIGFAMEKQIDLLLASPRYGERWARHWMDVVRFGESSGKDSNVTFPHAWRYRDYAVDAFNNDIPYDRFLTEQIAGDLLPADSDEERARLLIATGFLAFGTKNLNEMNPKQFAADLIDEQIDTVTRAFMAQSVACARCHDHKFDAFHMEDYYALAGVFESSNTYYGTWIDSENSVGGDLITLPRLLDQLIPNKSLPQKEVEKLRNRKAELIKEQEAGPKSLRDAIRILWQMGGVDGKLETVDEKGNALPLCMGVLDGEEPVDSPIYERGEVAKPGETVARNFPRVLAIEGVSPAPDQSGRLELAQWLTHPDHPLTARVMANRIWKHLIGSGIVRSVDNFGSTGQEPSHPELLDYLAVKFQENNWSIKAMIKEICSSRAYRQSSEWREAAFLKDPENRLLWRIDKKRLEAEAIRDAMLAISGELDVSRRPGSLVADLTSQSVALVGFNKSLPQDLDGSKRRSVYLPIMRDRLPDVLDLFDFAEPGLVTGHRDKTNVPVQSLYLMNSPFVVERSETLANRLKGSDREKIQQLYQLCLNRNAEETELSLAMDFLSIHQSWPALCQAVLSTSEFRNLD